MEPNQSDPTLEEDLKEVIHNLPPVIRDYVTERRYAPVVRDMVETYRLHVDQGTILEREMLLLLLGIEDLDEFTRSLMGEARVEPQSVSGIVADINAKILIPLREEMQNGPVSPAPSAAPREPEQLTMPSGMRPVMSAPPLPPRPTAVPPPPPPPRPAQVATPSYIPEYPAGIFAPPPQSPSYPNQEHVSTSYMHVVTPKPTPPHLVNKIPPPPTPPKPVVQPAQPLDSSHLLEDHEEASPSLTMPVQTPAGIPQIAFTSPSLPRPPAPSRMEQPQHLPGSLPPVPVPSAAPAPRVSRPIPASPLGTPPLAPPPASRPYTVDPYREPIDEGK